MTLRVPPLVGQNVARLPDGNVDPAHATDCGEACLASALEGRCGVYLTPGAIRQSLGLPDGNGSSTAEDLADWWNRLRGGAEVTSFNGDVLWKHLGNLRHYGHYCILLGGWLEPSIGHWVLAYQRSSTALDVMGPWGREYDTYLKGYVDSGSWGSQVWLH